MTWVDLLILLVIAGVCGAIGQTIAGYSRGGCLTAIAVGFIGALLGAWISRKLGLGEILAIDIAGTRFPIVWSIIGATLFVAVVGLLTRRAR
ncbi:MAG TPA: GlsB/YeaQ/YmgE family stress response membrane protein [Candidatus Polarisedimenticolaceae bacterium]|nr:GlsB/YeaQ/YmgE family stress response membrane protein [Candidatus Polarisedimenticolaceae bacterium]